MNISGMNKTSEDKALAIVSPVAPCQSRSYGRISCSPVCEPGNQSKPVSNAVNCHGLIDEFTLPLSGDSRESLLLRASLKNRVENHRQYSPSPLGDDNVCLVGSKENSSECLDLKQLEKCDSTPTSAFKSPLGSQEQGLAEVATEPKSVSNPSLSPHPAENCLVDSNHCNGSIVTPSSGVPGCFTPPGDVLLDVNGRSGSQTPASVNESDRIRMDLTKLDETIDYVLSYARSDEPCEGMFVLPCRSRDATHLSSPNLRANTPSSGILASPSSSPPPASPPPYRVISSPMLNQSKTQSLVQSSSVPCVVSQSVPRFIVDQASGVLHFPRSVHPSGGSQGVTQPTVSFVHVYSDSSTIQDTRVPDQSGSQPKSLNPATQMVLHSNVIHGFQNHVVAPQNAFAVPPSSVPRTFSSLVSPTKVNLVHALPAHVSRVGTLSPTYTSLAHVSEPTGLVSSRAVLFSPSNTVCVMQNPMLSPPVYETTTPSNFPTDHQTALTYTSFQSFEKKVCPTSPVSFRQPVVPQQSVIALSGQVGGAIPVITDKDNHVAISPPNTVVRPVPGVKKRTHNSSSAGNKRRKTVATASPISGPVPGSQIRVQPDPIQPGRSTFQECIEKLKGCDVKSLVSAPLLKPHSSVLLPAGGSDPPSSPLSHMDELDLMRRRGLKYSRGPLAMQVPKLPSHKDSKADSYILQHLRTTAPLGALVSPRKFQKLSCCAHPVCSSPEPPSFENHMRALFSSMHRPPKCEKEQKPVECVPTKPLGHTVLDSKLIPIFSEVSVGKPDPERCTPPLPLFHMPNPRLICQPICLGTGDREVSESAPCNTGDEPNEPRESKVSNSPSDQTVHPRPEYNGIPAGNSPLIDSETGEVVAGRRIPEAEQILPADTGAEKLHITFTINPSMTSGVSKIVRRIAELLGIDQNAVCYQVTRSGAQITLDQKQSQSESVMKNLESQLREQFTPLSLHVEKATNQSEDIGSLPTPGDSDALVSPSLGLTKSASFDSSNSGKDVPLSKLELSRYVEEPVSIPSLLTSKRTVIKPCQNCDKPVPPHTGHRKCLEEIAALSGLSSRTDLNGDFVFCSVECFVQFSRLVSNRHVDDVGCITRMTEDIGPHHSADTRQPTLACDFSASIPVLLHWGLPKTGKASKRHVMSTSSLGPGCKRRNINAGLSSFKSKRWRGSRWRVFSAHSLSQYSKPQSNYWCEENVSELLKDHSSHLLLKDATDHRVCILCSVRGDATEESLGRLLPYDVDKWLHINCALWCFEVYETVGGSLNNVDVWLKKATETSCSHCGNFGAGLPCYNPRCTSVYHVSCAVELKCMFFTDRGMYCPQHQPKEQHPMQLLSLAVHRRVYISRDENTQVGSVIHEEDRTSVVRIGTVYLQSVGQLLPHQIESGYFHARRYIYPVGFRSTRIYWSMRKPKSRARYVCEILENDGKPLFRITVIDKDMDDETFTHETCSGVWRCVLTKIEQLRERDKLVRLFPEHLKGEDLY
ncbi:unnamed protein product, partial [Echinostoma caproni]|uniref:Sorbin and SH3 domain-containing protein 1 n=1 Tax=Echinostoma caproni TaxID=27848 RepID=A0A183BCP7_9TREM